MAASGGAGAGPPPPLAKKLAWTREEDAVLREQVRLHGAQNWAGISEALAGRNPKSCRLRWLQHLSPGVDTAAARPFSPQEDEAIAAWYRRYPNRWATIALFLPGRSDNAVKNRWHSVHSKAYLLGRLPDGTLPLFPLAPGDVFAGRGTGDDPVLRRPPPTGVDLSGWCLKLFPLVAGDLVVRGGNVGEAAAMDVDSTAHEALVELRLWPSTDHVGVDLRLWPSTDHVGVDLRLWPSTDHVAGVQGDDGAGSSGPTADEPLVELRLWPSTDHVAGVQGDDGARSSGPLP